MMQTTLVVQSYRTKDVPAWIASCMHSVRSWAKDKGFSYHFVDDAFFDYAPEWVRKRCGRQIFPITDIARLYLLKALRSTGVERVIWVDADVLVFDPGNFLIDTCAGYAFSHEVMIGVLPDGRIHISHPSINNAVMVFHRESPMLDFYLFAAEEILRHLPAGEVPRTVIGPGFLVKLANAMPIERLSNVGLFTQCLMEDFASGRDALPRLYAQYFKYPCAAANLCHFVRHGGTPEERLALDALFEKAIERLLATRGKLLNQFLLPE